MVFHLESCVRARPALVASMGAVVGVAVALHGCATLGGSPDDGPPPPTVASVRDLEPQRPAASAFDVAIGSPDAPVRAAAALALARLERTDAAPGLTRLLGDADANVRATAAFGLGQLDLALLPGAATHQALRATIEQALADRLDVEPAPPVRVALITALGRVSGADGPGVARLRSLADGARADDPDTRARALTALGVLAQRRAGSVGDVTELCRRAINDTTPAVQEAGAYLAFRAGVDIGFVTPETIAPMEATTQIHLARALKGVDGDAARSLIPIFAELPNWGARVELARVLRGRPELPVEALYDVLKQTAVSVTTPGHAHVVKEICLTLAEVGSPSMSLPVLMHAVGAMPPGPTFADARCTCAAAASSLGGDPASFAQCVSPLSSRQASLLQVAAIAASRLSSHERAAALAPAFQSDDAVVRGAAAEAACDGTVTGFDTVASALVKERDPGVIEALVACFADGAGQSVLRDTTVQQAVGSVLTSDAPASQKSEPLRILAKIADTRPPSPILDEVLVTLRASADQRVRDAASHVAYGERAPGTWATGPSTSTPSIASLPLAAVLHTARGEITIAFEREAAPRTVQNFVALAQAGTLNGTPFHRVIGDFVAQGGDPRGDGTGGPGYFIPCENNELAFDRGAVGVATSGKDTGGSQFFLTHSRQPHLDGRYTLFAHVTRGLEVMDQLQVGDVLLSVEVATALRPSAQP